MKDPLALPDSNDYGAVLIGRGGDCIVDVLDKNALLDLKKEDEKNRGVYIEPND